MTLFNY